MFVLVTMSNVCSDPGLAMIITLIKRFVNIIWIVGPILSMVGAVIALVKMMSNPDEKKHKTLLKNMIIALLLLFFLPTIVNTVMKLFDDSFEISACWNQAESVGTTGNQGSSYINPYGDKDKTDIYTDPSEYETGEATNTTNSSSSSSTVTSGGSNSIENEKVIFVGDSRTVGMKSSVASNSNDVWSCKSSMGLSWMRSTGIPNVDSQITSGSKLVILMGVNDLYHVDGYITYINGLVSGVSSRGASIYFVSVNPTSRSSDYLNDDIDGFNQKMKSGLSSYVKYIDTNTYLKNNGFSSSDGLHYSATTYKMIYNYIKSNL